jgi:hypothetical protein
LLLDVWGLRSLTTAFLLILFIIMYSHQIHENMFSMLPS